MSKITVVVVVLFAMLSSLVITVSYLSMNQAAFVKAEVLLDIEFGTVFPGQVVTESFTITSQNSTAYTITLINNGGALDMRAYLLVVKDPAEADTDGPVSGGPDYTGHGSFASPGDQSDTWMVTLFTPDANGDYGGQISIQPVVVR